MNEKDLLSLWFRARMHIMVAQFAPTFLLTVTVTALALDDGYGGSLAVRIAAAGILLASGILGAVAQYTSASEAQAVAADLRQLDNPSRVVAQIVQTAWWTVIVKYVTPAIFVVIYVAILWQLFITA